MIIILLLVLEGKSGLEVKPIRLSETGLKARGQARNGSSPSCRSGLFPAVRRFLSTVVLSSTRSTGPVKCDAVEESLNKSHDSQNGDSIFGTWTSPKMTFGSKFPRILHLARKRRQKSLKKLGKRWSANPFFGLTPTKSKTKNTIL